MNPRQTPAPAGMARPHVPSLKPYTPGMQPGGSGWVKLNTNENPYPPSAAVEEAIRRETDASLRLYPDPAAAPLRAALAEHHGLEPENVCVGNGSDDILNLLTRIFCDRDRPAGFSVPSYSLYPVLVAIQDGRVATLPFDRSMDLDVDGLAALPANILFLTSPNAPTGVGFATGHLAVLAERFSGILVIDEAYADFADEDAVALVRTHPNVCVTRTFSKSYSLAGMRVGYALASEALIGLLDRVRDSYNVNRLSQAAALAALENQPYFRDVVAKIRRTRDHYVDVFRDWGWFTYDSQANFFFTEPCDGSGCTGEAVARSLYDHLFRNRVLVRHFPTHALTRSFLRITVGDEPAMRALTEHIASWPGNA